MKEFASLEQRMVNTYLDTFPPFVPSKDGPGIRAQEKFYQFLHGLYEHLSEEPELLLGTLHEDDAYTRRFNKGADNKPKLKVLMRRAIKKVDALLAFYFRAGQSGQVDGNTLVVNGSVKVSKKHRLLSEQLGLRLRTETASLYTFRHLGSPTAKWWCYRTSAAPWSPISTPRMYLGRGSTWTPAYRSRG